MDGWVVWQVKSYHVLLTFRLIRVFYKWKQGGEDRGQLDPLGYVPKPLTPSIFTGHHPQVFYNFLMQ